MQGVGVVGSANGTFNQPIGLTAGRRLAGDSTGMVSDLRYSVSLGFSNGFLKCCPSILAPIQKLKPSFGAGFRRGKMHLYARADGSQDGSQDETTSRIGPLELESPTGQLLSQILKSHPHLLPAAIDQQLERLAADRDAAAQESAVQQEQQSTASTELVLYRRIAELKAEERRKAIEEIIYALIVQKFMDAGVSLIPAISPSSDSSGKVDAWSNQDEELEAAHSPEALEMIREHLALVLGNRNALSDSTNVAQISKLRVGQVYAASVMYGYFLRRVDQHFQLEKSMKMLPFGMNEEVDAERLMGIHPEIEGGTRQDVSSAQSAAAAVAAMAGAAAPAGPDFNPVVFDQIGAKSCKLRSYVTSFDPETLQRYATMRSKEGVNIIEKHAEALFGRPEIQITHDGAMAVAKDEIIRISFTGLTSLVLEAVTFGTFLWDVESYVDSRYHFVSK